LLPPHPPLPLPPQLPPLHPLLLLLPELEQLPQLPPLELPLLEPQLSQPLLLELPELLLQPLLEPPELPLQPPPEPGALLPLEHELQSELQPCWSFELEHALSHDSELLQLGPVHEQFGEAWQFWSFEHEFEHATEVERGGSVASPPSGPGNDCEGAP